MLNPLYELRMKNDGKSVRDISRESGIPYITLLGVEKGTYKTMHLKNLVKLQKVYHIDIQQFKHQYELFVKEQEDSLCLQ